MININLTGSDTATSGAHTIKCAKNAVCKLARLLVSEGFDPFDSVRIERNGTLCFKPTALGWWAGHSTSETDQRSVCFTPYKPMPTGLHEATPQSPTEASR